MHGIRTSVGKWHVNIYNAFARVFAVFYFFYFYQIIESLMNYVNRLHITNDMYSTDTQKRHNENMVELTKKNMT